MRAGGEYEANATSKRGRVVDRDPAKHRIRVQFEDEDGMVSAWIDVLGRSAGGVQSFMMPSMGDEVWCALDPKGEDGCLIGSKYNDQNAPPFGSNEDVGMVWPGGSFHLDVGSGAVTVTTNGPVDITTSGDATIKAANIKLESATLTHNGVNIGDTHKHAGVAPGGAKTDVPS